jgi:hypothetical protein
MAVPRPLLLALLGTVLLAVTFMATLSSREQAADTASTPALEQQPAPAPEQPAPGQTAGGLSPVDVARAAFAPAKPIESASFDIRFNASELGGSRERQALRLTGSFDSGQGDIPSFDIRASEVSDGKSTHDRVLSTGESGYVFNGVTAFQMGENQLKGLAMARDAIAKGTLGASGQVAEPDPASWLKNVKSQKSVEIDGVETSHITATIDPKAASANVRQVVKSVTAASDEPLALPKQLDAKVKRALKSARLEAWVGTDDRILRRLTIDVRGALPKEVLEAGETAGWQMGLDVNLTKVNQPQKIVKPELTDERAPAKGLGKERAKSATGVFAIGGLFIDPPASVTKTAAALAETSQRARDMRKPRAVDRAVRQNKRVAIFFHQPNGLDDGITDDAVAALRKRSSAVVFQDVVSNVANYGQVVIGVGVTRAPSIVIIGKSGRARLIEGYIDSAALAQEVADTR